jgi:hypothetical protein
MWRQTIVQNWIYHEKYTSYLSNYDKSSHSTIFVATVVAAERMWLDTTDIADDNNVDISETE